MDTDMTNITETASNDGLRIFATLLDKEPVFCAAPTRSEKTGSLITGGRGLRHGRGLGVERIVITDCQ